MKTTSRFILILTIILMAAVAVWTYAQDGGEWVKMSLPKVANVWDLNSVEFADASTGWAVGSINETGCGIVLRYQNNAWEKVFAPCSGKTTIVHLLDVALKGPQDGWIVGDKYTVWGDPDRFKGYAIKITNGKCSEAAVPSAARSFKLDAVSIPRGAPDTAWAVGGLDDRKKRFGLIYQYAGSWKNVTPPAPLPNGQWSMKDIDCPAANKCWAVGQIIFPRWADKGEKPIPIPKDQNQLLVMAYKDGKWTREPTPFPPPEIPNAELSAVSFPTPEVGWAAGRGVMLKYANGKWQLDAQLSQMAAWHIKSINFPTPDYGYAVGWDMDSKLPLWLERTQSGWKKITTPMDKSITSLDGVFFLNQGVGWAAGITQEGSIYPAGLFSYRSKK